MSIIGYSGVTLRNMVTYVFNEYSVFDKSTREWLLEEANTPWTGG